MRWQTVQHWIQGKHEPDGQNLRAIAEALEMSPDELLGILDGQDPPFASWWDFLGTVEGQTITPEERRALAAIPWPRHIAPTVTSYRLALTGIRTGEPRRAPPHPR